MSWSLPAIILAAAVVSDVWRILGALVSARIDEIVRQDLRSLRVNGMPPERPTPASKQA